MYTLLDGSRTPINISEEDMENIHMGLEALVADIAKEAIKRYNKSGESFIPHSLTITKIVTLKEKLEL